MPVRRKAVSFLVDRAFGGPWAWNGLTGMIHEDETARSGMTTDGHDKLSLLVDDLFMAAVEEIDWTRVLIEAAGIHMATHPGTPSPWIGGEVAEEDGVCGECLANALRANEHNRFDPETDEQEVARFERMATLKDWAKKFKPWKTLPECYREDPAKEAEYAEARAFLDNMQRSRR